MKCEQVTQNQEQKELRRKRKQQLPKRQKGKIL
jgi:hypothetical protein